MRMRTSDVLLWHGLFLFLDPQNTDFPQIRLHARGGLQEAKVAKKLKKAAGLRVRRRPCPRDSCGRRPPLARFADRTRGTCASRWIERMLETGINGGASVATPVSPLRLPGEAAGGEPLFEA